MYLNPSILKLHQHLKSANNLKQPLLNLNLYHEQSVRRVLMMKNES